ncbi:hypothetical protein TPHA_0D00820 [Tetrapisispora phaffii CBS 4417]|uniref:Bromodomain associated domain-containing protein n=1 Tax=Tetrapisispora phaffii (strain ATCC 24235 / CBS 4417 / NBRC 1672 / NRRL Y-8282 / UCD 70-5) TaxID=1071381 RepID=G8BSA4_TETPH|nr:hypothetical protein TPHA_0D00820 [Tetrapisispora phaffii CBS 4417]CCE62725.1 hypothetical protein TPHA_0D00820 [Tetrapisispora phaffii CBS 4417]
MTSTSEFYYYLLRVSMLQLLKVQGFDRSKPSTVNAITDLYVKFLELLLGEITKLSRSRQDFDDSIALQDITQAFQNLGIIKPVDILDIYDENPELASDKGLQNFKKWWMDSDMRQQECLVSLPTTDLLNMEDMTLNDNNASTNINGSRNGNDNNGEGKTSSQQASLVPDYLKQLQNKDPNKNDDNENEDELLEDMVNNGDFDNWIKFVIVKQRLSLSKKLSKEKARSVDKLPGIAGLKNSVLDLQLNNSSSNEASMQVLQSDLLPSTQDIEKLENAPIYLQKGFELLKKLPIMKQETNLSNITLSYENNEMEEDDDVELLDAGESKEELDKTANDYDQINKFEQDEQYENMQFDHKPEPSPGSFAMGSHFNSRYKEMDDIDNEFQRESIDFNPESFERF